MAHKVNQLLPVCQPEWLFLVQCAKVSLKPRHNDGVCDYIFLATPVYRPL
jgi:hypothetical protein